ncbi:hypothetical protein [Rhodopirellula sp. MGV]|uniref:hypothetical protein n=1 Tax=Rhodopirellula sp. MGV TaxID=2023130 RepID=UPI000B9605B3|nr:hypothetical protein [Rhodopirellula sp. MGV]OYP39110.1 hypothetical protein CGZ80_00225 [Rhodopirellula sp. MGV]PNY35513.1 hypothetical protein C2E31_18620 [Rhodopirellula baltica]
MFKKAVMAVAIGVSSMFLFQSDASAGNCYRGRARSAVRYSNAYRPTVRYRAPAYSVGRSYFTSPVYRSPYYGSYRAPYTGSIYGRGIGYGGMGYGSFGPYGPYGGYGRSGLSIGFGF